jgi:GntR family transcriptional regulator
MRTKLARPLPLYARAKHALMQKLGAGDWRAGEKLPPEPALAASLGVSQGTVRRALDDIAKANLIVRRQGRGTFVAEHTQARALFHFFHLVGDDGSRALPGSRVLSLKAGPASREEAKRLGLAAAARVVRLHRLRLLDGAAAIVERIVVPAALFQGLDVRDRADLPNELYKLYQDRFGVSVARAAERLKAVAATPEEAAYLALRSGAPLLEIDRLAFALDGRPCEWRVSRCATAHHHYVSEVV